MVINVILSIFSTTDEKVQKMVEAIHNTFNAATSNPRITAAEKIQQLESLLKKRSGTALPQTHQIMIDLKTDLGVLYDQSNPNLGTCQLRIGFVKERLDLLDKIDGEDSESRLKGFLMFRHHNLLVEKVTHLSRKNNFKQSEMQELGLQLGNTLKVSAGILLEDQGCPPALIESLTNIKRMEASNGTSNGTK